MLNPLSTEKIPLLSLVKTFFYLGSTTFGGMWAATEKLEKVIVNKHKWVEREEFQSLMVAATLIPAPKFLSFGALVGFRCRGFLGSILSVFSLLLPASLLVLLIVILINPSLLEGPLSPLRRMVGITIIGLLIGNAYQQLKKTKVQGSKRIVGLGIAIGVSLLSILGVPLLVSAMLGFVVGGLLIKGPKEDGKDGEIHKST
jgi:chromate transporter